MTDSPLDNAKLRNTWSLHICILIISNEWCTMHTQVTLFIVVIQTMLQWIISFAQVNACIMEILEFGPSSSKVKWLTNRTKSTKILCHYLIGCHFHWFYLNKCHSITCHRNHCVSLHVDAFERFISNRNNIISHSRLCRTHQIYYQRDQLPLHIHRSKCV